MLKKTILLYHLLIGIYGIVASLFILIENNFSGFPFDWTVLGVALSFLSFKGLLNLSDTKYYIFFFLFNLIQVLTFSIFKFSYKFIYGSEFFLFLSHIEEFNLQFQFRYWIAQSHFKILSKSGLFFLGINLPQLLFTIYFLRILIQKRKLI